MNFSYKEVTDKNDFLDREDGLLPGITFTMNGPAGNLLMTGELSLYTGDVKYDGQTQSGTPVGSRTATLITDVSLSFAQILEGRGFSPESLYFGMGYRYWDRDIRDTRTGSGTPVLGLHEIYQLPYIMIGSRWNVANSEKMKTVFNLWLRRTVFPRMLVDLYDGVTLDLGEKFGYRTSITFERNSITDKKFFIEPFYEFWEIGKSNIRYLSGVGYIYEPKSTTNNLGLNIGLYW